MARHSRTNERNQGNSIHEVQQCDPENTDVSTQFLSQMSNLTFTLASQMTTFDAVNNPG